MTRKTICLSTDDYWLVRNFGPRCTLVSAASILQKLGAESDHLVDILEEFTGWKEEKNWLDWVRFTLAYLGPLDRGIEAAALSGGIRVKAKTKFIFRGWRALKKALDNGNPVLLNCYRAPSGAFSHSIVGIGYSTEPNALNTLDPNDAVRRPLTALRKICSVTFIEPIE